MDILFNPNFCLITVTSDPVFNATVCLQAVYTLWVQLTEHNTEATQTSTEVHVIAMPTNE